MIKLLFRGLGLSLRLKGYSSYFAQKVVEERWEDIFQNKNTTLKQKLWAQKRGFLSDKINFYGLTEENFTDYLPDFDYYRLHPINGYFSKWIDDKLTLKYILSPFSKYIPDYYYLINKNGITKLMDCPKELGTDKDDIINLLKTKKYLAAKLVSGSFAEGFYKLSYEDIFYINNKPVDAIAIKDLFSKWENIVAGGYIITEYLHTNSELGKIWNNTPNTLRIMTIRINNKESRIVSAFMRFGTKKTGVVDNASVGGVACRVDIETGRFFDGRVIDNDRLIECKYHPDTKALMEGILPYWNLIKKTISDIGDYIPQLKYMGYDVIITDEGFKIIEINSHQGIKFHQYYCPFFKNQLSSNFFQELVSKK
jgi:hypothetical protein